MVEGVVRLDGLEARRPLRTGVVESDEVSELVVSDAWVTVRIGDERELRLLVLDPEGFAETIVELWGVQS